MSFIFCFNWALVKHASRQSLLDTLQISKCLRGKWGEIQVGEQKWAVKHQFSGLLSLPEQKRCIPRRLRSQCSSSLDGNFCSIMRQIHLDSSWWRTGSLIGSMQLSETFLCLMIYPQAVWALVGKYSFIVHLWTITVIVGFNSPPMVSSRLQWCF